MKIVVIFLNECYLFVFIVTQNTVELPMRAMICSLDNLMGMRSKRSSGPSSVSQTVAELGFEPRTMVL